MGATARRLGIATAASLLWLLLAWSHVSAQAVVGGGSVPIASFPFQVALYDPAAESVYEGQYCGGVILDATHVATAAHCVFDATEGHAREVESVAVLAGTAHLNVAGEAPYPDTVVEDPARWVSFDPAYEPELLENDVAVVTLSEPLYTGSPAPGGTTPIAPVPLVSAEQAETIASPNLVPAPAVTLSGFGDTRAEDAGPPASLEYPQELHAVEAHLVSEASCAKEYESLVPITAAMICAGEPEGGRDACYGDSGGPLVVNTAEPADPPADYALVGLTDFAEGCALRGYAGVYVRVSEPAIRAFLTSSPPPAPAAVAAPRLSGEAKVGATLVCSGAQAPAGTTLEYRFFATVSGEAVALDAASASGALPLAAADAGDSVFCRAQASDAGGYSFADSTPATIAQYSGPAAGGRPAQGGSGATSEPIPLSQAESPAGAGGPSGSSSDAASGAGAGESTASGVRAAPRVVLLARHCGARACTLLVRISADRGYRLRASLQAAGGACKRDPRRCKRSGGRVAVSGRKDAQFALRISDLPGDTALVLSVEGPRGTVLRRRAIGLPRRRWRPE